MRCLETAARLMAWGSASSFTVSSPDASRASIARRADVHRGVLRVTDENLEEVVARVLSEVRGSSGELFLQVLRYMIAAYGPPRCPWIDLEAAMRRSMNEEEESMLSRAARELLAEGEARGEAKALRRILERRFGALPPSAVELVAAAGPAELERWLDRAVDAPDLGAVFVETAKH